MVETFEIQSDIANIPVVEERLFHFCQNCNIGSSYSTVSYATLQAVENAIVHGNGCDESKKVSVCLGTCRGGIFVEVVDQGRGFDYSDYGELPSESATAGEGIFVMNRLSDRLEYTNNGSSVRMEFMMSGIDQSVMIDRIEKVNHFFSEVAVC